ncbi:MAG: hypothetical protein IPK39_00960 [Sulfuritalea sp.]|nr:hypothetical protein [Sulfuritalea sp.]
MEEIDVPDLRAGAPGVLFEESVPFDEVGGYSGLELDDRLIIGMMSAARFIPLNTAHVELRDVGNGTSWTVGPKPASRVWALKASSHSTSEDGSVPRGGIPCEKDTRGSGVLVEQDLDQVDH